MDSESRPSAPVTRRHVLAVGAGAAASVAFAGLPAWARAGGPGRRRRHRRRPDQLPHPDRPMGEPGIPQIETLVLVMFENHSADNLLGMLPRLAPRRRNYFDGLPVNRRGVPVASNPDAKGKPVYSFRAPDLCPAEGLTQNWNSSHRQYDNGRNDGFVRNSGSTTPMSYFLPEDVPILNTLAARFPLGDRYFCSMLGQTLPNRRYWFSGTSSGQVNDDNSSLFVPAHNGTIFDRLDSAHVDWRVYYSLNSAPTPFYFPNFRDNPLQVARCMSQQQFFSDAAAGRLPPVCYVEANGSYQSEENPQNIAYGESFLHDVVQACMNSPQWSKLAMVVNYDEHGGYYDHVVPPLAVPPDDIPPDLTLSAKGTYPAKFDRYGFRVPFVVVSPWAQPDYVSHKVMDHTSVLALIEHKWNLPPMTKRDAGAWPMLDMFDTSRKRLGAIELPPPPSIDQTTADCKADGKNPPTPMSSVAPSP